jgi:sphingolipid delta-4 desaturase
MGYHNEHHDLPSIPWNNLPKLRAMAPEFYNCLRYHPSWSGLLFQFIFDERYTLFSRIERMKKSGVSAATVGQAAVNRQKAIAIEAEIAGA